MISGRFYIAWDVANQRAAYSMYDHAGWASYEEAVGAAAQEREEEGHRDAFVIVTPGTDE